ncbi:MAG: SDR family oxidoreductase [Deltaproteobacteria bacterium]|nr:SDR family oxidoreductase [Deltaproteobacteria bacterium]
MSDPRRWLLVLGASSGIGAGCARAFAEAGYGILGVHLDRRNTRPAVEALESDLRKAGAEVCFFNGNAADDAWRSATVEAIRTHLRATGGRVDVLVHSLAFGSLGPLVGADAARAVRRSQWEMTLDVMASSLAFWTRDLVHAGLLGLGGRVFALTSQGTDHAWPSYGPVSAAKAVLDALVRQLALELAPLGITVNAVQPGVTDTPALRRIPGWEMLVEQALRRNPHGRLTTPEDVGRCLVDLSRPGTSWMTGNRIRVDGGEDVCG